MAAALPAHAPRILPRMAPGAHYVRLLTEDARVLGEHVVDPGNAELAEQVGVEDRNLAFRYLRRHPDGVVFHLVYDGDDGQCLEIHILAPSDLRAFEKAQRRREAEPQSQDDAPATKVIGAKVATG